MLLTAKNAKLYIEDSNPDDAEGSPLFFLYGLGCSIFHWKYQMRHFRGKRRIIWSDYRGHGKSVYRKRNAKITVDQISDDILRIVEKLKLKEVVFLGQSMGGTVALDVARKDPDKIAGLVLMGTPGRGPSHTMRMGKIGREAWNAMILTNNIFPQLVKRAYKGLPFIKTLMRELVRKDGFNPRLARTSDIDEYVGELLKVDPNLFWELAEDLETIDVYQWEKEIPAPTLVIAGSHDHLVPVNEAKRLAQKMPRGELSIFPHGSHCPHLDDPAEVNRVIAAFLSKHKI